MKKLLYQALERSLKILASINKHSAILMLHRVGRRDPQRIGANQNMVITSAELYDFIVQSKRRGWSFISLDELIGSIKKGALVKKALVLTFDDGYLDNFSEAAPVLCANKVPFLVYISTGFIDSDVIPWWYVLEAILNSKHKLRLPDGLEITLESLEEKQEAFLLIRQKIMASGSEASEYKDWMQIDRATCSIELDRLFMNWGEVEQLASLPNATIGAHTHSHPVLLRLSDDEAFHEIRRSKEILENKLARPIRHFAYPFGGPAEASDREFRHVEALGFETAVTTRMGSIDSLQINRYSLPRCFYGPGLTMELLQNRLFEDRLKSRVKRLLTRD